VRYFDSLLLLQKWTKGSSKTIAERKKVILLLLLLFCCVDNPFPIGRRRCYMTKSWATAAYEM
jgi:hypothetical protein